MSLAATPTQHPAIEAASRLGEKEPKPRSRRTTRTTRATRRQADKPKKVSFYLSPEASKRLGVTAVMEGESQSAIVERLVMESCRRWVVSDRGGKPDGQENQATTNESAN